MFDQVLPKQRASKSKLSHNPGSFEVRGHQITVKRDGKAFSRDAQKWMNFKSWTKTHYSSEFVSGEIEEEGNVHPIGEDSDAASYQKEIQSSSSNVTITYSSEMTPPPLNLRRSTRERRHPALFKDYQTETQFWTKFLTHAFAMVFSSLPRNVLAFTVLYKTDVAFYLLLRI